jgi:FMN-dependent NADH-azoreductase
MKNVLLINSSITGDNSVSRQLASELVEHLAAQSSIALVERDFAQQEIPHLDGARLGALFT